MISFLCLGLIFSTQVKVGHQLSADVLVMFASPGGSIALPCAINSLDSCSSINWDRAEDGWIGRFGTLVEVVRAGMMTAANAHRYRLLNDCSLQINNMTTDDARVYTCDNGKLNSVVALSILQLMENPVSPAETIELQCYLNIFKGFPLCNFTEIQIRWSMEDNTPIHGDRFHFEHSSDCLEKLFITKKATDHFRNWKCHLIQSGSHKATASIITKIAKDGIEEVFAAVGESVSFSCSNTSSLGLGGEQPQEIFVNRGSSSVITKVNTIHSGDYKCSDSADQHRHFRLHTFDITSEYGPDGNNLTLTCALTCANRKCEEDFNLTWSNSDPHGQQTLRNIAWLALPVGVLVCIAVGGIYAYMKRKHNRDEDKEQADIRMAHVYEDIQDVDNGELQQQSQLKRGAATTDSFYDLLQAVN